MTPHGSVYRINRIAYFIRLFTVCLQPPFPPQILVPYYSWASVMPSYPLSPHVPSSSATLYNSIMPFCWDILVLSVQNGWLKTLITQIFWPTCPTAAASSLELPKFFVHSFTKVLNTLHWNYLFSSGLQTQLTSRLKR